MNLNWYETLNKPVFTPPSTIFAPVWIVLYLMMFASFIIFLRTETSEDKTQGILLFFSQLVLNLLWSPVFFYWKNIDLSMVIIILMLAFLVYTLLSFFRISKLAGLLLIPYFLWVCFATYLNYGFMIMN